MKSISMWVMPRIELKVPITGYTVLLKDYSKRLSGDFVIIEIRILYFFQQFCFLLCMFLKNNLLLNKTLTKSLNCIQFVVSATIF
jgi:hypothetical protein